MRRHSDVSLGDAVAEVRLSKSPASLDHALQRVVAEIQDGLRHGYFDFNLSCEIVGQERRRLTLRAGKSYQFFVPKDDCVRTNR